MKLEFIQARKKETFPVIEYDGSDEMADALIAYSNQFEQAEMYCARGQLDLDGRFVVVYPYHFSAQFAVSVGDYLIFDETGGKLRMDCDTFWAHYVEVE